VPLFKAPYPQLDPGERTLAEVASRGETAVLTHRRLVIAGRDGESSTALAHIASLRVRFERLPRAIFSGLMLLAVASILYGISGPVRGFLVAQGAALEAAPRAEATQGAADDTSLSHMLGRIAGSAARAMRAVPWFAALLALFGVVNLVRGLLGRTIVSVYAGGGELELVRLGRSRPIEAFVQEVGRHLPAPTAVR
jgi:hypothetical protein